MILVTTTSPTVVCGRENDADVALRVQHVSKAASSARVVEVGILGENVERGEVGELHRSHVLFFAFLFLLVVFFWASW